MLKIKVEKEDDYYQDEEEYTPPRKQMKLTIKHDGGRYKVKGADSPLLNNPKSTDPGSVQFCCHLCTFKSSNLMNFTAHLYSKHKMGESPSSKSNSMSRESSRERDSMDDDVSDKSSVSASSELVSLKCWTCPFSTYSETEFSEHVRIHCVSKPFQCKYCDYCANQRFNIKQHCLRAHPHQPVFVLERTQAKATGYQGIKRGYDQISDSGSECGVNDPQLKVYVSVEDILQIPQIDLEELLSSNGVTGIRL